MKIYTKTGDEGTTGLFSGRRVSKNSTYIESYGTVDEVNSYLGFCATATKDDEILSDLYKIQNDLHVVCADLATPHDANAKIERVTSDRAQRLEGRIDHYEKELIPLTQFILAGGTELSARFHIARTVCRRAERVTVHHGSLEKINKETIIYLNRLSDFLFVLARVANSRAGVKDIAWNQSI